MSWFQRKPQVLILDDDAAMRRLFELILKRERFAVEMVWNGNEAIEKLKASTYDAVVLDLMMPHEGGFSVLNDLRERDAQLLRRVIVVTAAPASVTRKVSGEVFAVMQKPIVAPEFVAMVRQCVGQKASG